MQEHPHNENVHLSKSELRCRTGLRPDLGSSELEYAWLLTDTSVERLAASRQRLSEQRAPVAIQAVEGVQADLRVGSNVKTWESFASFTGQCYTKEHCFQKRDCGCCSKGCFKANQPPKNRAIPAL